MVRAGKGSFQLVRLASIFIVLVLSGGHPLSFARENRLEARRRAKERFISRRKKGLMRKKDLMNDKRMSWILGRMGNDDPVNIDKDNRDLLEVMDRNGDGIITRGEIDRYYAVMYD